MPNTSCPICRSTSLLCSKAEEVYELPFAFSFSTIVATYLCEDCGAEGDFTGQSDEAFNVAKKVAITQAINKILDDLFSLKNISGSLLERCLSLPPGVTNFWREGKFSESDFALLCIINTYPWLLELALGGYDRRAAEVSLIVQSSNLAARIRSIIL